MAYAFNNDKSKFNIDDVVRESDIDDVVRESDIEDVVRESDMKIKTYRLEYTGQVTPDHVEIFSNFVDIDTEQRQAWEANSEWIPIVIVSAVTNNECSIHDMQISTSSEKNRFWIDGRIENDSSTTVQNPEVVMQVLEIKRSSFNISDSSYYR